MTTFLFLLQLAVTLIMGAYFYSQLRAQKQSQPQVKRESNREMDHLHQMRAVHLSEPLAEHVRPQKFSDIIGQEEGIKSLKAILCGKNPQHVIIYGPPGIGKTCAARLALEAAKLSDGTPFSKDAPFIEMDATCVRFDERAIADPLIGSVHDPIYQGAGQLGVQGVPQPKPGAVSRAHGGVLFLDEIGELHPIQMNKLLKVLEDRRVMFESAYYNPDDSSVPRYIHDIFKNGMPADFRLIGATTRSPEELSPALRSRCMEIYFRALTGDEVTKIAYDAAGRAGFFMTMDTAKLVGQYAACGRDAVNMVQMAAGVAQLEKRQDIRRGDMEWVIRSGHYASRPDQKAARDNRVGAIHALAVFGTHQGAVMEIEAAVCAGHGHVSVTGIVEEEEIGSAGHTMKRKSTAYGSAENVKTLLKNLGYARNDVDLHINFPGGAPVDGPSAGLAMALVSVSALTGRAIAGDCAVTGEISVQGFVRPVGGVPEKIDAAKQAGLARVIVPSENMMDSYGEAGVAVIPVNTFAEALGLALEESGAEIENLSETPASALYPLSAACKTADNPL